MKGMLENLKAFNPLPALWSSVLTIGEERQCDPDLSFLSIVSNTALTQGAGNLTTDLPTALTE